MAVTVDLIHSLPASQISHEDEMLVCDKCEMSTVSDFVLSLCRCHNETQTPWPGE